MNRRANAGFENMSETIYELAFSRGALPRAILDGQGCWINFNQAFCDLLGHTREALLNSRFRDHTHPEDVASNEATLRELLRGRYSHREVEKRYLHADGTMIWVRMHATRVVADPDAPPLVLTELLDITDWKSLESQLTRLATTDAVTGVYNRRFGLEFLQKACAASSHEGQPLCLILFDLDHFKAINDEHGHEKGDEALQATATVTRECLRGADILARWGGEEFAIVLPNTDLEGAAEVAHAVLAQLETCDGIPGRVLTASFGVVQYRAAETPQQLIARADDLMYRAKRLGRARICTR